MSSLQAQMKNLHRFEPIAFLLLLVAHLAVLFRYEWYPTLDGPAHLYNAHLIQQMLLGNEFLSQFLLFSSFPEPNWSGHAIMAALSLVLPANWVEKGLVLLIFCGTAIGFRVLIRSINREASLASLLIFPFLCTYTFRMGFFNFSISVAVFLFILALWQRIRISRSPRQILLLSLMLGMLYFSNALTTLVCIGTIVLWIAMEAWRERSTRNRWLKELRTLAIAAAPWLVLIVLFVVNGTGEGTTGFHTAEKLWTMVRDAMPFTMQNGVSMLFAARLIAIGLILLLVIALIDRSRSPEKRSIRSSDIWLGMALLSLAGYLILPEKAATGWFISVRFLLFFYLFIAIWLAVQPEWPVISIGLLLPYVLADLWLVYVDHRFTGELSAEVIEMRSAIPHVRDQGIILPLLYTENWMISNFSNYLGTERGILVIDNYEAMSPHFPLRWRPQHRAPNMARSFFNSNRPCIDIDALGDSVHLRFDHVIRWEFRPDIQDSCTADLSQQLSDAFELKHHSPGGRLELHQRD